MRTKKTKKDALTKLAPENFESKEANEQALDEYYNSSPIVNYFQFFFGKTTVKRINQEGKPPTY